MKDELTEEDWAVVHAFRHRDGKFDADCIFCLLEEFNVAFEPEEE